MTRQSHAVHVQVAVGGHVCDRNNSCQLWSCLSPKCEKIIPAAVLYPSNSEMELFVTEEVTQLLYMYLSNSAICELHTVQHSS